MPDPFFSLISRLCYLCHLSITNNTYTIQKMDNFVINGDRVFCSMTKQEFVDNYQEMARLVKKDVFAEKKKEQKKKWNHTAYMNRVEKQKQVNTVSKD